MAKALAIWTLFLLTAVGCFAQTVVARTKECQTSSGRVNLTEYDVLGPRTPNAGQGNYGALYSTSTATGLPSACQGESDRLRALWRQEDLDNWDALANRACAAKQGWVENSPGICTAGGPPPICPRTDHWHIDHRRAMSAWADDQQKTRLKREQQLVDATCGCWKNTLRPVQDDNPSGLSPQQISNSMVVPCSGTCPGLPGHVCRQGFCVPDTQARLKDLVTDKAADKYKEGIENLIKDIDPELLALTESVAFKVLGGSASAFLTSTPVADWGASYKSSIIRVQQKLSQMRVDLTQYKQNGYAANVWKDRDDLQTELDNMNTLAAGLITERGLGADACYSVIDYQNSALNASFGLMFSKMPPRPQVGPH